jgi:putative endonuclease
MFPRVIAGAPFVMAGLVPAIHVLSVDARGSPRTMIWGPRMTEEEMLALLVLAGSRFVMAGLVPAIHERHTFPMRAGWVYIMTNKPNGTLYVGVTSNLPRRVFEHRDGLAEGFTKRYGLKRLVYVERHEDIREAIQREHNIKHWPRAWKVRLILAMNPHWDDLGETLF